GRTTDADVTGLSQQEMPSAQSKYAVFQCLSTPGATGVTLPRAAHEIVLSTKPNRIETTFLRMNTMEVPDPENAKARTTIRVGHGLRGYSDTNLSPAD